MEKIKSFLKQIKPAHIIWALIIIAVATRFFDLGARMFHHDESIHAWMSWNLISGKGYKFDPPYHGPFLYHLEALIFALFSISDFSSRILVATFGVGFIALLWLFLKPQIGLAKATVASGLALISPIIMYYSRFNIHDIYILVFSLTMIMSIFAFQRTKNKVYLYLFFVALALAFSTKLIYFLVLLAMLAYGFSYWVFTLITKQKIEFKKFFKENKWAILGGAGVGLLIVIVFFASTFGSYFASSKNFFGSIGDTFNSVVFGSINHWLEMHQIQRIKGPFHFYLPIITVYEPLILLGFFGALFGYAKNKLRMLSILVIVLALSAVLVSVLGPAPGWLESAVHMQSWHLALIAVLTYLTAWTVISLWRQKRNFLAFWIFAGTLTFFMYSYLGEKVPWLTVHILLPWLIVATIAIVDGFRALKTAHLKVFFGIGVALLVILTLNGNYAVNGRNRINAVEPMVQVQNTSDVKWAYETIRKVTQKDAPDTQVTIHNAVAWPFVWFLRDWKTTYPATISGNETTPIILTDNTLENNAELSKNYVGKKYHLNNWSWWISEIDKGNLISMFNFMIFHKDWGAGGWSDFVFWVRKDLESQIEWQPADGWKQP